jgi:hypothetical protein
MVVERAIQEIEDIFVSYSEDTLERITPQTKLKKQYVVSVCLLKNDIQMFANLYKRFRSKFKDFFGEDDDDLHVPVVPELSSVFEKLQSI